MAKQRITGSFIKARRKVVEFMKENPNSTLREISAGSGVTRPTVKKHLAALVDGGLVSERAKAVGAYAMPAYTFNGVAATKLDEITDEIAAIPSMYDWAILIDGESYKAADMRLYLVLDGTETGLESGKIEDYGFLYKDLPILDWHVSIYYMGPIEILMDGNEHQLSYFDQRYKVWIQGNVILIDKAIQQASLTPDGSEVLYEYHVNGMGRPATHWQPRYHWVTPTETLNGEIRKS